jgi:uncharacterized protein (DUF362 family)
MNASIVSSPGVGYPDSESSYCPSERYPEYRFDQLATRPNEVYAMVRRLFAQLGLDRQRFGTPEWNPLGRYIARGSSVFVLPNFVYHRRVQDSVEAHQAKCTHGSVLRAVIDYVLLATGREATIRFGNSALQSCNWNQVLRDTGADRVAEFYRDVGARVEPTDLRLYVAERSLLGRVTSVEQRERPGQAVEVDLGRDSLLAELGDEGGSQPRFRVSDYDPRRIEAFHAGSSHRYVINRAVLEADVVLSLPKLKTHEKVGITCGLKGFVGTVGHKDCLAHHRLGSPGINGDEYPQALALLRPLSEFHDWLNKRPHGAPLQGAFQILDRTARRVLRRLGATMGGAWYGNDTAWRMTLDLARIVHFADVAGQMHDEPQRRHLLLIDGIIAGEGDGPLVPSPAPAGTLVFSDHVARGDRLACRLMGFEPESIALIHEASRSMRYPISDDDAASDVIRNEDRNCEESDLQPVLGRPFRPPSGWRSRLAAPTSGRGRR